MTTGAERPVAPALVPVTYKIEVEGKWVTVSRAGLRWLARRGQQYVCDGAWEYKRYSTYDTAEQAAQAAIEAPRAGEGIRDGWWADDRW